jgi:glutaredoxin-related protein
MIILYVLETCPYCQNAIQELKNHKIKYKTIIVNNTEEDKNYYKKQNKMNTFPQIFMQVKKEEYMKLGGYTDLLEIIKIYYIFYIYIIKININQMIILYVLETCPYCQNAIQTLQSNKIKFKTITVNNTEDEKNYYKKQNKMNTFPQIFMQVEKDNYMKLGGNDDLMEIISICKNIKNSNLSMNAIYYFYDKIK